MPGLYFEQFSIGQRFEHAIHRTVTETDNVMISALTMNPAALHLDYESSKGSPFGKPLVNSVYTLGLMVGISVYDTTHGTTTGATGVDRTGAAAGTAGTAKTRTAPRALSARYGWWRRTPGRP